MIRNPNISFFQKIVYSLWAVLGLAGCMGSSPCAASSGCSSAHVRAPHCAGSSGYIEQQLLLSVRAGSSLRWLLWLQRAGATRREGFSRCNSQALEQSLVGQYTILAVPRHTGSSQIRDQNRVSCIGRQILYH